MDCPVCNRPVRQTQHPDGTSDFMCPGCGWASTQSWDAAAATEPQRAGRPGIGQVLLFWLLAVVVVVGPYLALRFGIPALLDIGIADGDLAAGKLVALIDVHYWWVFALYVGAAAVFTPTYDSDNVGFMGGMVDNPFSWQDDWERRKRTLLFLLLPGKTVVAALVLTYHFVRG